MKKSLTAKKTHAQWKSEYDEVQKKIDELYELQEEIREEIRKTCEHELVKKAATGGVFDLDDDEETKYKCASCYRYFTHKQVLEMKEKKNNTNK